MADFRSPDAAPHEGASTVCDLTLEALCASLSFVLRSSHCLAQIRAVSRSFHDVSGELLSWRGSAVCIGPHDLEVTEGRSGFEGLVPMWTYCDRIHANFHDTHIGAGRTLPRKCLQMMATNCREVSCLTLRNWFLLETQGLTTLQGAFPKLRHLEFVGCDQIRTYSTMIPIFKEHPTLLSLRASFQPKAVASEDFVAAAPATLTALGFINIDAIETFAMLFERCSLQHFWFEPNSGFGECVRRQGILERLATMQSRFEQLRTLSLPSSMREEHCAAVCALCPKIELICRMRIGSPEFGTQALQSDFEPVPESGGVALRRRGTNAALTANGSLWAPYEQDDDVATRCRRPPRNRPEGGSTSGSASGPREIRLARPEGGYTYRKRREHHEVLPSFAAFASELADAAAARRR